MLYDTVAPSGDHPVANLGAITQTATTSCTYSIAPGDSAYDNGHAAEDIERYRAAPGTRRPSRCWASATARRWRWRTPARTRTRWPGWALDSPLPLGIAAEAAIEQRVKGQQAALDAWAAQCAATNCPLAPDPKGAVDSMLAAAREGNGPGGASLASSVADAR